MICLIWCQCLTFLFVLLLSTTAAGSLSVATPPAYNSIGNTTTGNSSSIFLRGVNFASGGAGVLKLTNKVSLDWTLEQSFLWTKARQCFSLSPVVYPHNLAGPYHQLRRTDQAWLLHRVCRTGAAARQDSGLHPHGGIDLRHWSRRQRHSHPHLLRRRRHSHWWAAAPDKLRRLRLRSAAVHRLIGAFLETPTSGVLNICQLYCFVCSSFLTHVKKNKLKTGRISEAVRAGNAQVVLCGYGATWVLSVAAAAKRHQGMQRGGQLLVNAVQHRGPESPTRHEHAAPGLWVLLLGPIRCVAAVHKSTTSKW